jgi:hypothetical protein
MRFRDGGIPICGSLCEVLRRQSAADVMLLKDKWPYCTAAENLRHISLLRPLRTCSAFTIPAREGSLALFRLGRWFKMGLGHVQAPVPSRNVSGCVGAGIKPAVSCMLKAPMFLANSGKFFTTGPNYLE